MPIPDSHWQILKEMWEGYEQASAGDDWDAMAAYERNLAGWIPDLIKEVEELKAELAKQ